ncbi:beta-glucoside kinase [Bacillus ectoiniformans]|uniref:ROK family protein n=1 Tax=Bacillus ectoiniformans TaxID=1494429 RepID=UPI0019595C8C|nr:ROK family protein [Bacillus ectoiniformans]MBM7650413.1 beta-glucoside kinase [Bacillus ectoiniformans]
MKHLLACDIGGTDLKVGTFSLDGELKETVKIPLGNRQGQPILSHIESHIDEDTAGLALSIPGFIDPKTGFIEMGGAIVDFNGFNIVDYFQERYPHIPVTAENDANCVALAEKWKGHAKAETDFLCMTIGTGIGGAIYLNDALYRGVNNRSGEFGHMFSEPVTSKESENHKFNKTATMAVLREKYAEYINVPFEEVTGEQIFEAYDSSEEAALHCVGNFYKGVAMSVLNLYYIFAPPVFYIGGGITSRQTFLSEIKERIVEMEPAFSAEMKVTSFGNQSGMIGAVCHHLESV